MNKYGWKGIGIPDQRDTLYAYKKVIPRLVEIPRVKYLICPPVADQGGLGACVYFSLTSHLAASAVEQEVEPVNLSQMYGYYRYRELNGRINSDDGCYIREAVKLANKEGICHEETWPYVLANWNRKPTVRAYSEAPDHRVVSYHAIEDLEDMLQSVAAGFGFIGGIAVFESVDSEETTRTGVVKIPGLGEKLLGGHALFFCGYDLNKGMFKFQNSWGTEWGDGGFGWIPFQYLVGGRLAGDFWSVRS